MAFSKNWIAYIVSQGEPFTVDFLNRAFGNRKTRLVTIDDMTGEITLGFTGFDVALLGAVDLSGADSVKLPATAFIIKSQDGLAAPGSLALAGAAVGDQVLAVTNVTTPGDVTTDFEATISVAGHIQQTGGGDLHLQVLQFIVLHS
jgi:hypothetical protein